MTSTNVIEQHNKIIILASSPEARKFKPIKGYTVIAVNDAIHIAKQYADYWFTLDPSESNLKIMEDREYGVKYYTAIPEWFGKIESPFQRLRQVQYLDYVHYLKRVEGAQEDQHMRYGLCTDKDSISTGNSAYGALNLAYHMNPKEIVILGVNGDRSVPKFDNSMCIGKLDHIPRLFESAKKQLDESGISVYNANRYTMLKCFEYTDMFD